MESEIVQTETGLDKTTADQLVKFASLTRNLKGNGLEEGASTRLLVHAAKLISSGIDPIDAVENCISEPLSDDPEILRSIKELSTSVF